MRVKVKCQRTIYYDDEIELDEALIKEIYGEVNDDTIENFIEYDYPLDDLFVRDEEFHFDIEVEKDGN